MFEDDEKPIRYHLSEDFALDPGEPVFLDTLETGTLNWVRGCDAPEDKRQPESLRAFVREVALTQGGEAWRAMSERGELLCIFSVYELAEELSGKKCNTMHPSDQYFLRLARACLDV
jgi:hypothetical protein